MISPVLTCVDEAGLRQQPALFQVVHHVVLPYASLRLPLPERDAIPGTGSIKGWQLELAPHLYGDRETQPKTRRAASRKDVKGHDQV